MKYLQDVSLRLRREINQNIAATDQINPGEGRIAGSVMFCEDTERAHILVDLIVLIYFGKEFFKR